jgi:hypothetical protein
MSGSSVLELRGYSLRDGKRDVLIRLFETDLIAGQETSGMSIVGTFLDLDDVTRFVWLRAFASMDARARSLQDFYTGPVWKRHRQAANETMVDSSDVLLLRPARDDTSFRLELRTAAIGAPPACERGILEGTVLNLDGPADAAVLGYFEKKIVPAVLRAGARVLGWYVTEESENNFPALPIREGEHVLVWFAGFADRATYDAAKPARAQVTRISASLPRAIRRPTVIRLVPTRHSLLSGLTPAISDPDVACGPDDPE